jgi:hypothetical protein
MRPLFLSRNVEAQPPRPGLELTREARGAQVWLPVRAHGAAAFGAHLDWCLDATQWLARTLQPRMELLELAAPPSLSIAVWRVRAETLRALPHVSADELVAWVTTHVNTAGRVLLAPTHALGAPLLRVCVLSCATEPAHLSALVEDLLAAEAAVRALLLPRPARRRRCRRRRRRRRVAAWPSFTRSTLPHLLRLRGLGLLPPRRLPACRGDAAAADADDADADADADPDADADADADDDGRSVMGAGGRHMPRVLRLAISCRCSRRASAWSARAATRHARSASRCRTRWRRCRGAGSAWWRSARSARGGHTRGSPYSCLPPRRLWTTWLAGVTLGRNGRGMQGACLAL